MKHDNFPATACRLIRDISLGLGRDYKDINWIMGFCAPMIGNVGHECGGFNKLDEHKPTVKGSLGGISFPQWTGMNVAKGGRRGLFMAWCRKHKLHPYSYEAGFGFMLEEFKTTASGVPAAVLRVKQSTENTPTRNGLLYDRVKRFERLYERAGITHYDSRYKWAVRAIEVYTDWARKGFPEPAVFVMPRGTLQKAFDTEFGSGVSSITQRFDGRGAESATLAREPVIPAAAPPPVQAPGQEVPDGNERTLTRDQWRQVQTALRRLGYVDVGTADGRPGRKTRTALAQLQANAGIKQDGLYGPATRDALLRGVGNAPPRGRTNANSKVLLALGEPTIAAVQPVSLVAKVTTWVSVFGTTVMGIATIWPQASSALDTIKMNFTEVPPYVWTIITGAIAAYMWWQANRVKHTTVQAYKAGELNTIDRAPLQMGLLPELPSAEEEEPDDPPGDGIDWDKLSEVSAVPGFGFYTADARPALAAAPSIVRADPGDDPILKMMPLPNGGFEVIRTSGRHDFYDAAGEKRTGAIDTAGDLPNVYPEGGDDEEEARPLGSIDDEESEERESDR